MTLTVHQIDRKELFKILHNEYGINITSNLEVEHLARLISELIRNALVLLCYNHLDRNYFPVFITRLVYLVQRQINAISPISCKELGDRENTIAKIKDVLKTLVSIGDVIQLDNGYYLPAPVRFVEIPQNSNIALLIGGISTKKIENELGLTLQFSGLTRFANRSSLTPALLTNEDIWQGFPEWLSLPYQPNIEAWIKSYYQSAKMNLLESGLRADEIEIYSPSSANTEHQFSRWIGLKEFSGKTDSLLLCRTKINNFQMVRYYYLVTIRQTDKSYVIDKELTVPIEQVRRLQYGIDLLEGKPTTVLVSKMSQMVRIELRNRLPAEESKLVTALTRSINGNSCSFPLVYEVGVPLYLTIEESLNNLGIRILVKNEAVND